MFDQETNFYALELNWFRAGKEEHARLLAQIKAEFRRLRHSGIEDVVAPSTSVLPRANIDSHVQQPKQSSISIQRRVQ